MAEPIATSPSGPSPGGIKERWAGPWDDRRGGGPAELAAALDRCGVRLAPDRLPGDGLLETLAARGLTFHLEDGGGLRFRAVVSGPDGRVASGRGGDPVAIGVGWALVRLLDGAAG